MKKRILAISLVLGLMFCLAMGSPVQAGSESTMNIKFSTWHPPVSREVKTVWIPMLEELKKRSNGRITYTLYPGGALGKGPEHFDIVKNGLSDMGYFTATWTPGRFPLTDVLSLAAWVDGKDLATNIGNQVYEKALEDEFKDVKVLELNGCIQAFLWTTKPVQTIDDLTGLKIRTPGGQQTNYIKALGAEPVFMPLGDVYLAMETGTIDGLVTCPPLVLAFKLHEVAKYGVKATFGCVSEGVIMNKKSWENTPDDLKPIIEEVVGNPFATTHGLDKKTYAQMMEELNAKGVKIHELTPEQEAKWYERFQEQTRQWVADLEKKGLNAKEAVIMYGKIAEAHGTKCVAIPPEWRTTDSK
ncbi:MAG: TRAP transporter substrate-binding protein [Deltaproteobacteria bacterium]|nr:TRAP transporter substrate-binding protein [Deltaproteobacteria bacterium]